MPLWRSERFTLAQRRAGRRRACADLPEGTTHAIDIGAGGLSGIGPLTARNLDGRGVRVVVIGE